MENRFRIGYPHAVNSNVRKESVVILKPSRQIGFDAIYYNGKKYNLIGECEGTSILSTIKNGVQGTLIEANDIDKENKRESIVGKKSILGEGVSMQLALVLITHIKYNKKKYKKLPLLLFSAAISCKGNFSFKKAEIKRYFDDDDSNAKRVLKEKYIAAKMAKSRALILPEYDAKLLSDELNQKYYSVEKLLTYFEKEQVENTPDIIGVSSSLSELAEMIGIDIEDSQNDTDIFFEKEDIINLPLNKKATILLANDCISNSFQIKKNKEILKKIRIDLPDTKIESKNLFEYYRRLIKYLCAKRVLKKWLKFISKTEPFAKKWYKKLQLVPEEVKPEDKKKNFFTQTLKKMWIKIFFTKGIFAGFFQRSAAVFIDIAVLFIFGSFLYLCFKSYLIRFGIHSYWIGFLSTLLYFSWCDSWRFKGQTIGKKIFKIQTIKKNGLYLKFSKSLLLNFPFVFSQYSRYFLIMMCFLMPDMNNPRVMDNLRYIFFLIVFGNAVFIIFHPLKQGLGNLLTASIVINKGAYNQDIVVKTSRLESKKPMMGLIIISFVSFIIYSKIIKYNKTRFEIHQKVADSLKILEKETGIINYSLKVADINQKGAIINICGYASLKNALPFKNHYLVSKVIANIVDYNCSSLGINPIINISLRKGVDMGIFERYSYVVRQFQKRMMVKMSTQGEYIGVSFFSIGPRCLNKFPKGKDVMERFIGKENINRFLKKRYFSPICNIKDIELFVNQNLKIINRHYNNKKYIKSLNVVTALIQILENIKNNYIEKKKFNIILAKVYYAKGLIYYRIKSNKKAGNCFLKTIELDSEFLFRYISPEQKKLLKEMEEKFKKSKFLYKS